MTPEQLLAAASSLRPPPSLEEEEEEGEEGEGEGEEEESESECEDELEGRTGNNGTMLSVTRLHALLLIVVITSMYIQI